MIKKPKKLETEFKKWLIDKEKIQCLSDSSGIRYLYVLGNEVPLYSPLKVLGADIKGSGIIGRPDLFVKYDGKKYICEVKYIPFTTENFWSALKCLAYCEYYKWQTETSQNGKHMSGSSSYSIPHPAIFMPLEAIKLEHEIIAKRLKITLFGIIKKEDKWLVKIKSLF